MNAQTETETDHKIALEAAIGLQEAALEKDKLAFIEKEKALHSRQHTFNDLVQELRSRENDKNLASQRLDFLQEKEGSLQEFLVKTKVQLTHLQENISFTGKQVEEEAKKLQDLQGELGAKKAFSQEKRRVFDDKRNAVEGLRAENTRTQRLQFEAEKKCAVADTSIVNLQRSIRQREEEGLMRESQIRQLEEQKLEKEQELESKRTDLLAAAGTSRKNQRTDL